MRLALAAVLLALVLVGCGEKSTRPEFSTTLMVPGRSIGGVSLGMSMAQAKATWGPRGRCEKLDQSPPDPDGREWSCTYDVDRTNASFVVDRHGVELIAMGEPRGWPGEVYGGLLADLRTKEGIGLGSSAATVRGAYPGARPCPPGSALLLSKRRGAETMFALRDGHVSAVMIDDDAADTDCSPFLGA